MATRNRSLKRRLTVSHTVDEDTERMAAFTPDAFLQRPRRFTVAFPATDSKTFDQIRIEISEGDWEHDHVWVNGTVGGAVGLDGEEMELTGTAMRVDQLELLIKALQLAVTEARRIGFATPRRTPRVPIRFRRTA